MDSLHVCLFGFPQISLDGRAILPKRSKVLALLVYLLANGEAYSREILATLFWPDQDAQQAFAYLRNALWEVRRLLGEDWLDLAGKTVRFRLEKGAWVDTRIFEEAIAAPEITPQILQEAVDLYRGDFLAGFSLPDSLEFDDWQVARAEELRRLYDQALARLVKGYIAQNELDAAVAAARRRVDLDPLNEAAQRDLIELLARSGQRSAAIHQFEACQRTLKDELGITPEPETEEVYRRVNSGEFTPARQPEAAPAVKLFRAGNLPSAVVPLIGRVDELAQLAQMLADPGCRLISIIGPGGAGKTRLALEAARQQAGLFPDGAWLVPLAPVEGSEAVLPAIIEALHLPMSSLGGKRTETSLVEVENYLKDKQLLLLVDNLEHLLTSDLPIKQLLEHTHSVKFLVTSRERLSLPGEWVIEIAGLPVPGFHTTGRTEEYEAAQLFLAAARRARASFKPEKDDWNAIERICQQVDGLPLGLELAAAWVRVLSCTEIANEIEKTLDFLYTSQRGTEERQRSLRATFDYSWTLLSESERSALRRLTVFQGGFNRQAAAQVAGVPLQVLSSLVDKSLLRRSEAGRFDLHAVIRQYAYERLSENPSELEQLCGWHCGFFLNQLSDWFADLKGSRQIQALEMVSREQSNLFAAWNWAVAHQQLEMISQTVISLALVLIMRGMRQEGQALYEPVVKLARQSEDKILLAFLLAAIRYFTFFALPRAKNLEDECQELLSQTRDSTEKAFTQILLAVGQGTVPVQRKQVFCRQSGEYLHAQGDDWGAGIAILVLADSLCLDSNQSDAAEEAYRRSLEFFTNQGNQWGRGLNLFGLALIANDSGQYGKAARFLEECIPIYEVLGDASRITDSRLFLGRVLVKIGRGDEARRCLEANLPLLVRLGWKDQLAIYHQLLQEIKD